MNTLAITDQSPKLRSPIRTGCKVRKCILQPIPSPGHGADRQQESSATGTRVTTELETIAATFDGVGY
ncbi:hypothetical protein K0M31_002432 [Melipona bicolor]|uniref:Uncharacterized protein n=1 Tax=Melipona bicolor TaxID=60889 RepID=A0AA40GHI7_9HYME|nr:hypothetical protein K0M31_002432 [Melipona bicolor]